MMKQQVRHRVKDNAFYLRENVDDNILEVISVELYSKVRDNFRDDVDNSTWDNVSWPVINNIYNEING